MGIDKMILMGATMDPDLLKKATLAHHKAIGSVTEANPVMSKADFEAINAGIGRLIASVPESQTMDVYNSVAAAAKLSDAAYPFIKSAPWDSDIYLKPLPGVSPYAAMKAIDKAIVMGANIDGKVLSDAAMAHHKALGSMDSKLVTTAADYQAVNAGIGKMIASVPSSQVMDVFNAFSKVVPPTVPNNMFSMSAPSEATAAYDAFLQFKDVVKAAQR